jgi:hypothetical protein
LEPLSKALSAVPIIHRQSTTQTGAHPQCPPRLSCRPFLASYFGCQTYNPIRSHVRERVRPREQQLLKVRDNDKGVHRAADWEPSSWPHREACAHVHCHVHRKIRFPCILIWADPDLGAPSPVVHRRRLLDSLLPRPSPPSRW